MLRGRERERDCMCVRESLCALERKLLFVCKGEKVCDTERNSDREKIERVYVSLCALQRNRNYCKGEKE